MGDGGGGQWEGDGGGVGMRASLCGSRERGCAEREGEEVRRSGWGRRNLTSQTKPVRRATRPPQAVPAGSPPVAGTSLLRSCAHREPPTAWVRLGPSAQLRSHFGHKDSSRLPRD